uniref:Uncharacterized protein n=1 Tax=Panagrolaimus davidi TaxID=227884 RepID=A0A914QQL3_9BILA
MSHFNDFLSESQPKRIKIDETLNVQPRKSCMKPSASLPSHFSSYNTYTIEDHKELMDSEDEKEYESREYDEYEEEEERSSRSRSVDVEEEEVLEDKYEHDEEKYEPQVIQKLLAKQVLFLICLLRNFI